MQLNKSLESSRFFFSSSSFWAECREITEINQIYNFLIFYHFAPLTSIIKPIWPYLTTQLGSSPFKINKESAMEINSDLKYLG